MSNNIVEMSRVRQDDETKLWVIEIFSAVSQKWLVQGEFPTEAEARNDLVNWR